jgi:ankyrin repeat protein
LIRSSIISDDSSALHISAQKGDIEICRLLLRCSADVNAINDG